MSAFSAIDIATTGVNVANTWLDVTAHNMANVNTVVSADEDPFRAHIVFVRPRGDDIAPTGSGARITAITRRPDDPITIFEPDNPIANDDGFVNKPIIDLATQMGDLILAQRSYQANIRSVQAARTAYEEALRLGQPT